MHAAGNARSRGQQRRVPNTRAAINALARGATSLARGERGLQWRLAIGGGGAQEKKTKTLLGFVSLDFRSPNSHIPFYTADLTPHVRLVPENQLLYKIQIISFSHILFFLITHWSLRGFFFFRKTLQNLFVLSLRRFGVLHSTPLKKEFDPEFYSSFYSKNNHKLKLIAVNTYPT